MQIVNFHIISITLRKPSFLVPKEKREMTMHLHEFNTAARSISIDSEFKSDHLCSNHKLTLELLDFYWDCGFVFSYQSLLTALSLTLPNGLTIVRNINSNKIASAMMSRHLPTTDLLPAGRIDWLATHPEFRSKGLGLFTAAQATIKLLDIGYKHIWVTTQLSRPSAIKIFKNLGFINNIDARD